MCNLQVYATEKAFLAMQEAYDNMSQTVRVAKSLTRELSALADHRCRINMLLRHDMKNMEHSLG